MSVHPVIAQPILDSIAAIELAISDHKAHAKSCIDWEFVDTLRIAQDHLRLLLTDKGQEAQS